MGYYVENVGPVHIQETITVSILLDEVEDPDILSDVIEEILKPLPEPDPLRDLQILQCIRAFKEAVEKKRYSDEICTLLQNIATTLEELRERESATDAHFFY